MTNQQYADELQKKEQMIDALQKNRVELRDNWVKYACPFKIGETLIGNSYSFTGRQFVVEEVGITEGWTSAVDYKYKWKWVAMGPILNKNGTAGKKYTRHAMAVTDIRTEEDL